MTRKKQLALCSILLCLSTSAQAQIIDTVKKDGSGNFTTIQACVNAMVAGRTCMVYVGTYNEVVTVSAGTAGQYKTVKANPGDIVKVKGFTINSYTKVVGFTITDPASPASRPCVGVVGNSTDWYIVDNVMTACGSGSMIRESFNFANTGFGVIQGNTLSYGCSTASAPNVCKGIEINGDHHLIENNDISHVSDGISTFGKYNVYRNNTMHDTTTTDCGSNSSNCHIDFIQSEPVTTGGTTRPTQYNVWEGNTLRNNLGGDAHSFLTQGDVCGGQCFNAIIRFNDLAHVGSYNLLDQLGGFHHVKSYNNSIIDFSVSNFDMTDYFAQSSTYGAEINNLFYWPGSKSVSPYVVSSDSTTGFTAGSNLAYCGGTCNFYSRTQSGSFTADAVGNLVANPLFINYSANDFRLQPGSPAINAGSPLTRVANSDTGSGISLIVNDASFFQDGYGLATVQGDWVRVGPVATAQIVSINYSTNTLALSNAISRSPGDPVYLYKDSRGRQVLLGSAPDIGAHPFSAGVSPSAPKNLRIVP